MKLKLNRGIFFKKIMNDLIKEDIPADHPKEVLKKFDYIFTKR